MITPKSVACIAALFLAAAPGVAAERYVFATYGMEQGLTNLVITQICQDHRGFLWIGTENGLFQYDGHRFQFFGMKEGLPSAFISAIYESPDGTLWVGTLNGPAWKEGTRFIQTKSQALARLTSSQGFASDGEGHVYMATSSGLAVTAPPVRGQDIRPTLFPRLAGTRGSSARSVFVDASHAVWFGCGNALCRMEGGQAQLWGVSAGVPSDSWERILQDSEGNLWARSNRALIELEHGAKRFRTESTELFGALTLGYPSLALDSQGALLVPTNRGVVMGRPGHWNRVGHRQGLPMNAVGAILQDADGNLWMGTSGAGLARWAGYREWKAFSELEGLAGDDVVAILGDPPSGIWVGTSTGLSHGILTNGAWQWQDVHVEGISSVTWLSAGRDGEIWILTDQPEVVRFDPKTHASRHFGPFRTTPSFIALDTAGRLWITDPTDIYRVNSPSQRFELERVTPKEGAGSAIFSEVVEDARGDFWAASYAGLFRFANGKWRHYGKQDGLRSMRVADIALGPTGDLWLSYEEPVGTDRVRSAGETLRVENFDRSKGLPSDRVYSMQFDREGGLWALTDAGAALRQRDTWIRYGEGDGLIFNDCNARSFWSAPDGSVWIGTGRGLSRFQPGPPRKAGRSPKVLFSEIRRGARAMDPERPGVTISGGDALTVRFSAMVFDRTSELQYRYRVTGLVPDWQPATRPEVSLNYLPAGKYGLAVEARLGALPWGEPPAMLALQILPRWYEAAWFRGLMVVLCGLAMWSLWQLRAWRFAATRRALEREVGERTSELLAANHELSHQIAERELADRERRRLEEELLQSQKLEAVGKLAGGIAHDFNNLLTVINGYSALVLEKLGPGDALRRPVTQIKKAGDRAAELTQQLLAFGRKQMIQPVAVDLNQVLEEWREMVQRLIGEDIRLNLRLAPNVEKVQADPSRLLQVCLNLAANARDALPDGGDLWFETGNMEMDGEATADLPAGPGPYVTLSVSDTGTGMDEETRKRIFEPFFTTKEQGKGTGLGLASVYGIVKQAGGHISVWSEPGRGTKFTIYLPVMR
ncbi:putative Histidine kinase [Candidatus Sulfopaludibacter sp. SbA3]|nr:putative Histidine kinase [Candidatus Sulfopaludibacter sp. SbA3]